MTIQAHQKIGMRGFFTLQAHQEDDDGHTIPSSVRELGEFENLILDNGLELMKGPGGWIYTIAVGSGSTAPAVSDTQLAVLVASIDAGINDVHAGPSDLSATPAYASVTMLKQFAKGAAAGNLSEIGVGASTTSLFSRSLIKDANGNPTTVTVLDIELLTVTYELRMYFDTGATPVNGSVTIEDTDYATTAMIGKITANTLRSWVNGLGYGVNELGYTGKTWIATDGALGDAGKALTTGTTVYGASYAVGPKGSMYVQSALHVDTSTWNMAIAAIEAGFCSNSTAELGIKVGFSPVIVKNNTKEMDITIQLEYGRYKAA